MTRRAPRRSRAFTLIEVLVALAIVAVALAAGMRALAQTADGATTLKLRTLALWVAENRLAQAQLQTPWPAVGAAAGSELQANVTLDWRETVRATPNPAFRRIEIVVTQQDLPDYALARLVGYLGNAPH
ncbi:MAG TPA: type II secretion system minor pseudopilin GspI [Casimicrobiaceae bacterium]|nr:type II secretion system minor pseudopilin GspI [Casimicrobiaceae bacterium]